ncbi:MAG: ATP-binding protein [Candidatus Aenigmarchaeota archaeon]|nr:ATP-binding protein [Candidatus Aenigmarchaeota archaeon]
MPKEYGTVISTLEGPSTRRFSFVINRDATVRRGQFVQLETEDGKLIGRVADILKTNRYFMRPESVKEYEASGKRMDEIFPVNDWEYLVADASALGVFGGNGFVDSSFPPSPGTKVAEPETDIITRFFGLDDSGLHIGKLSHHDISARLNMTRLLQKHLAILAISGAGKSFLTSVIIEELLSREPGEGIAVIVVDTHGEYTSFAEDGKFSARARVFPSREVQIGLPNISSYAIAEFSPDISAAQRRELAKVMSGLKRKNKHYGMAELIDAIDESDDIKAATKDVLVSTLEELRMTGLFGASDYPALDELARQGMLSVIDVSDIIDIKAKQMIVGYLARKLFNARKNGVIPPFVLVVEEAHQFVPEQARKEIALSRGIITTIAREGRKFNASLCLISQRPIQLSTTALSQCNTHIILRITNPYDLKHIGESSEGLTRDVLRQISSLPVGTGIIVGEAVNHPLLVRIRKRNSKASQKGISMEQAAREFHERVSQKSKDAKSFM